VGGWGIPKEKEARKWKGGPSFISGEVKNIRLKFRSFFLNAEEGETLSGSLEEGITRSTGPKKRGKESP